LLRQKLGASIIGSRNAARMSAVSAPANELTNNWLRRIGEASPTAESKDAHSQLQAVLDFYNRSVESKLTPIDWAGHKERIHTEGVVDKIQAKYEKFMASSYSVDAAVSRCGASTEKMQALDVAMQYNFMLYFVHYTAHLNQLETIRNIGDINSLSNYEVTQLMPGFDTLATSQQEIANIAPDDYTENGIYTRLCTQFAWGSRYCPPFSHSSDALNAVSATLGKMGK